MTTGGIMNQKGIATVLLVAIVAGVLLVGGGAAFMLLRSDESATESASTESGESSETSMLAEPAGARELSGSYFDVVAAGNPVQCSWRAPEELASQYQIGEGQMYTDGVNKAYVTGSFDVDGTEAISNTLIDEEFLYVWTEIPGFGKNGSKIARAEAEAADEDLTDEERQQAEAYQAEYSFNCQPWTVDEAVFELPGDITFADLPAGL